MLHSLIHFSTLASGLFEEGHPPADLMTIQFGLTPFGVIVVVLLLILLAWVAMSVQAGRADLHVAASHGDHHGDAHHDDGHHDAGHASGGHDSHGH